MNIVAIITGGIVITSIIPMILDFVNKNLKDKREKEIEKIKYQKEIMELEVEREKMKVKLLEEENKKLDRIIYEK
jgi:hypothetical protein